MSALMRQLRMSVEHSGTVKRMRTGFPLQCIICRWSSSGRPKAGPRLRTVRAKRVVPSPRTENRSVRGYQFTEPASAASSVGSAPLR
jgi:hypothetical protein